MTFAVTGEGTLTSELVEHDEDERTVTRTFTIHLPVRVDDLPGTLTVTLRHPETNDWRALGGRTYRFDGEAPRTIKKDGQEIPLDEVSADIRTAQGAIDTFASAVTFGPATARMSVQLAGETRTREGKTPFALDAVVQAATD
jgi:hypothetical protein